MKTFNAEIAEKSRAEVAEKAFRSWNVSALRGFSQRPLRWKL